MVEGVTYGVLWLFGGHRWWCVCGEEREEGEGSRRKIGVGGVRGK